MFKFSDPIKKNKKNKGKNMDDSDNEIPSLNLGGNKNTGFNLGNLEALNNDPQEDKKEFSWEFEFTKVNSESLKEIKILENIDRHTCIGFVSTIEGDEFEFECSMAKGIKILKPEECEVKEVFDGLERFLMRVSPAYFKGVFEDEDSGEEEV